MFSGDNAAKQKMIRIASIELHPIAKTAYRFYLDNTIGGFNPTLLGVNLKFHLYQDGRARPLEPGAIVDWIQREKPELYELLRRADNNFGPRMTAVELALLLFTLGFIPVVKKTVNTDFITSQPGYEQEYTRFVAQHALFEQMGLAAAKVFEHVVASSRPEKIVTDIMDYPGLYFFMGSMSNLLAVARLRLMAPGHVDVAKIGFITQSVCPSISDQLAGHLVFNQTKVVTIDAYHIHKNWYLKNYLKHFKYGFVGRIASSAPCALVDKDTWESWFEANKKRLTPGTRTKMTFFRDEDAIAHYIRTEDLLTHMLSGSDPVEVYCDMNASVADFIQSYTDFTSARVLIIRSIDDYRDLVPKRPRFIAEEDIESSKYESESSVEDEPAVPAPQDAWTTNLAKAQAQMEAEYAAEEEARRKGEAELRAYQQARDDKFQAERDAAAKTAREALVRAGIIVDKDAEDVAAAEARRNAAAEAKRKADELAAVEAKRRADADILMQAHVQSVADAVIIEKAAADAEEEFKAAAEFLAQTKIKFAADVNALVQVETARDTAAAKLLKAAAEDEDDDSDYVLESNRAARLRRRKQ